MSREATEICEFHAPSVRMTMTEASPIQLIRTT